MSLRGPNLSASYVLIPRGDEYDGRRNPRGIQLSLQVDARSAIQVDIQNQASCGAQIGTLYEAVDVWKVSTSNPCTLRSRSTAPKTLRSSSRTWISLRDIILGGWRFLFLVVVIAAASLGGEIAAPPITPSF